MTTPLANLERFARLAEDFLEAAERADVPTMDSLMERRRKLLGRLGSPATPGAADGAAENERRRELLERILDLDRRAGLAITGHRDDAGRELSRLDEGKRGLDGYRHGPRRGAKWIDARG